MSLAARPEKTPSLRAYTLLVLGLGTLVTLPLGWAQSQSPAQYLACWLPAAAVTGLATVFRGPGVLRRLACRRSRS